MRPHLEQLETRDSPAVIGPFGPVEPGLGPLTQVSIQLAIITTQWAQAQAAQLNSPVVNQALVAVEAAAFQLVQFSLQIEAAEAATAGLFNAVT